MAAAIMLDLYHTFWPFFLATAVDVGCHYLHAEKGAVWRRAVRKNNKIKFSCVRLYSVDPCLQYLVESDRTLPARISWQLYNLHRLYGLGVYHRVFH